MNGKINKYSLPVITCIDTNRVKVDTKVYKVKNGDSMENLLKDLFDELSE